MTLQPSRVLLLLGVALAPGCATAQSSCPAPVAIDSAAMMRDLYRLADDSMGGRLIGSIGNLKARDYLAARFDAIGIAPPAGGRLQRIAVTPSPRLPGVTEAWNVIGVVKGTATPERYIVVTAHFDHVGIGRAVDGDSIYNGSDDNASGAAALPVLAEYFMAHPLEHTLIFAAVDGEERGMFGSRGLVDSGLFPLDAVDLNVNMDMVSRNTKRELYAAGPGRYPALPPFVAAAARCTGINLMRGHDTEAAGRGEDWTGQSDHAAFHQKGIPFLYFGVEDHPDYHRPGDSPDRAMPAFYVEAIRTVGDVIRRTDAFRR
ncbi:MAG TPA: M28 family peptidase [Gemmatimonadales bacterium]|nr:M28 family peptidase [Gemmatimonadales bacterium]